MRRGFSIFVLSLAIAITPVAAAATESSVCSEPGETETVLYTWRLRGGLAWLAGLAFPTSGTAELTTTARLDSARIETELMISGSGNSKDYYRYQSEIEEESLRTLMSFSGYAWGKRFREETTHLDYGEMQATRVRKSYKEESNRVKTEPIERDNLKDILTGIYYLRANADEIDKPIPAEIYSDGDLYPVLYNPLGKRVRRIGPRTLETIGFEITARPGDEKKWPGGVEVWFTTDGRGIPVRIAINQRFATMELDLASAACGTERIILSRK